MMGVDRMISGTVSAEDHIAAQRLHARSAQGYLRTFFFLAAAITVLWFFTGGGYLSYVTIVVCGCMGGFIGNRWYLPRRIRKLHRQRPDFASPFTYAWTSEQLEGTSAFGNSRRRWDAYHKFKEDDRLMLLYQADNVFEVFPKVWFANACALEEFRALAATANNKPGKSK